MSMLTAGRSCWVLAVESLAIAASTLFWVLIAMRVAAVTPVPNDFFFFGVTLLCGVILADAVSGFVHWFCDTFFEEKTPLIGPRLIASFREHHRDPLAMTRHGFLELNGTNCIALTPILAVSWWFGPVEPQSDGARFSSALMLSFSATIMATNQFHRWAHQPNPPFVARVLQRCGLALSSAHHARHHAPPHRSAYCVTNGWTNGLADHFLVFAYFERLFVAMGVPRRASEIDK